MAAALKNEIDIPIIRFTLAGARGVGKTRLIDSFLNNNVTPASTDADYQNTWYMPTTDATEPRFYYRYVRFSEKAMQNYDLPSTRTSCIIEIEDTPPATILEVSQRHGQLVGVLDDIILKHPFRQYLGGGKGYAVELQHGEKLENLNPFGCFDYNRSCDTQSITQQALVPSTMQIVIVFAYDDPDSLKEAQQIFRCTELIKEHAQTGQVFPNVVLVGNKQDIIADGTLRRQAEDFANQSHLTLFNVSARTGSNVDRLFEDISARVISNPRLSDIDFIEATLVEEEEEE